MKRVSKTLRTQNWVSYEYKGRLITIFDCRNPNIYLYPNFYFEIGDYPKKEGGWSSLSSIKRAYKNWLRFNNPQ